MQWARVGRSISRYEVRTPPSPGAECSASRPTPVFPHGRRDRVATFVSPDREATYSVPGCGRLRGDIHAVTGRPKASRRQRTVLALALIAWTFLRASCAGILAMSASGGRRSDESNTAGPMIVVALISLLVIVWVAAPWLAWRRPTSHQGR